MISRVYLRLFSLSLSSCSQLPLKSTNKTETHTDVSCGRKRDGDSLECMTTAWQLSIKLVVKSAGEIMTPKTTLPPIVLYYNATEVGSSLRVYRAQER